MLIGLGVVDGNGGRGDVDGNGDDGYDEVGEGMGMGRMAVGDGDEGC